MQNENAILAEILKAINVSKYSVVKQDVKADEPDLILQAPDGKLVLIEIKNKTSPLDSVDVAEVYRMKKQTRADEAFLLSNTTVTTSGSVSGEKADVRIMNPDGFKRYLQSR